MFSRLERKGRSLCAGLYIYVHILQKAKALAVHLRNLEAEPEGLLDNPESLNKQLDFRQRAGMNR